jgi:transmembrane sensor
MITAGSDNSADLLDPLAREAHEWVMRFAAGHAGGSELEAFKQWAARDPAHADAFARACQLWETLAPAAQMLSSEADPKSVAMPGPNMARRAFIGGALAASAAGAAYLAIRPPLGLWPSWSEFTADYRTGTGEQRRIVLSNGPSLELNTRTSVALRNATGSTDRFELIGGEAAIAIRSDRQRAVEVIAGDGRVIASDATFNLRYEGGQLCATCVTGELEVERGGGATRLRAAQQILYSSEGLGPVTSIDPVIVTAWKDGVLVFHAMPLSEVVAEINRYRSGRIILTNATLGRRLFNARFQIAHIDEVVTQIQQVFGARVTLLPGSIVLLG